MFTSLVLVTTMLLAQGASPFTERILIDHHKAIPLRDGVTVYADVYRPSREGRFPAIVVRTPPMGRVSRSTCEAGMAAAARAVLIICRRAPRRAWGGSGTAPESRSPRS